MTATMKAQFERQAARKANDNTNRHYWGITRNGEVLHTGTHKEMWDLLTTAFKDLTVQGLVEAGIKLTRVK